MNKSSIKTAKMFLKIADCDRKILFVSNAISKIVAFSMIMKLMLGLWILIKK